MKSPPINKVGGFFMHYRLLNQKELDEIKVGEAITLTAVMAIVAIAVMAVVVYKLFRSGKGGVNVPGGWKFSWA